MIKKPDNISDEHFERMVDAMLAHRAALAAVLKLPPSTAPRSKEYRHLGEKSQAAHRHLLNTYWEDE